MGLRRMLSRTAQQTANEDTIKQLVDFQSTFVLDCNLKLLTAVKWSVQQHQDLLNGIWSAAKLDDKPPKWKKLGLNVKLMVPLAQGG